MTINRETIEILPDDPLYPRMVGEFLRARPVLSATGNPDLLRAPAAVGLCGSRKASEQGIAAIRNVMRQLAEEAPEIVLVSGNAAGADLEAHYTALKHGAGTILVLPEGIGRFRVRLKLREVWDWDKVLVISQFSDNAGWTVGRAMARNHLILALSRAMLVAEMAMTGGTKAAADAAIRHKIPLFTIGYRRNSAPGNVHLYRQGCAKPIGKKRGTDRANVDKIVQTVMSSRRTSPSARSFALQ